MFYSNENANQESNTLNGSLLYHNRNQKLEYLSVLVDSTNFVSNGIRGMYVYDAAVQPTITLVAVNVSNNNQGVYINRGGGDYIVLNIFSSIFTFNSHGALTTDMTGNHGIKIIIHNTTFAENIGNEGEFGTAIRALLTSPDSAINTTSLAILAVIA